MDQLTRSLLQTPAMIWPLADTVIYFAGYLMVESFWTPYLMRSAGATQYQAALAFFISGGSYVLSSIAAGFVSFNDDKFESRKTCRTSDIFPFLAL